MSEKKLPDDIRTKAAEFEEQIAPFKDPMPQFIRHGNMTTLDEIIGLNPKCNFMPLWVTDGTDICPFDNHGTAYIAEVSEACTIEGVDFQKGDKYLVIGFKHPVCNQ